MKLLPVINRDANLFYFLHNVARCEWPWPYRPSSDLGWEKKFGSFSKEEKEALEKFRKIYSKYFLKLYLGKFFFLKENIWDELQEQVGKEDARELKKSFSVFEEKFEEIFREKIPFLSRWQREIKSNLEDNPLNKLFDQTLSSLFKTPPLNKKIKVFLLFAKDKVPSENYASGVGGERGRGLDGEGILLEFSNCPITKINYVTGVIWHEVIHSHFMPVYLRPLILSTYHKNKKISSFIEEVVIRSLFPIGILSIRFLNAPLPSTLAPNPKDPLPKIDLFQTVKIINLTDSYLQKGQAIDSKYIKNLHQILNKQIKPMFDN